MKKTVIRIIALTAMLIVLSASVVSAKYVAAFETSFDLSITPPPNPSAFDIVFVLDSSDCNSTMISAVNKLLGELQVELAKLIDRNPLAGINIGASKFKGGDDTYDFQLTPVEEIGITDSNGEWAKFLADTSIEQYPGTNIHAGLLGGKELLDNDAGVPVENKYLILISDGVTYLWNDTINGQYGSYGINYYLGGKKTFVTPDIWTKKNGDQPPSDWATHFAAIDYDSHLEYAGIYSRNDSIVQSQPAIDYSQNYAKDLYTSVDISLMKCYEVWSGMDCQKYAVYMDVRFESYPFAQSFMVEVFDAKHFEGANTDFSDIVEQIVAGIEKYATSP